MIRKNLLAAGALLLSISFAQSAEIVRNGQARAVIVLETDGSRAAHFGALELQYHIKKLTGCELLIQNQPSETLPTRIYVGASKDSQKLQTNNDAFASQEYLIKVQDTDIFLLGRDDADPNPVNYNDPASFPDFWKEQGTVYAVYDFLEHLGIRWYLPTDLGIAFTPTNNLTVDNFIIKRTPTLEYRDMFYLGIPASLIGDTVETSDRAGLNERERRLWYLRRRHGGKRVMMNHSMYTFYSRFWPDKKDWFAQGYDNDKPAQLCYSNPEVVAQVVQDARDFFDGKIADPRQVISNVSKDYVSDCFPVWPMDNRSYCKCPECRKKLADLQASRGQGQFSNDLSSNYMFAFVNQVAKELKKSHPDKFIGTGAYAGFSYPPSGFKLEDNIRVMLCLFPRMLYSPAVQANDDAILQAWENEYPEMKKYVWMYYCFPSLSARQQQWRMFPGFFASHVGDYFQKYLSCNLVGMWWEPSYLPYGQHSVLFDQLEGYINWKLAWDGKLDSQKLFDEFFQLYYGPAELPMKNFYCLVESVYSDPKNYPDGTRHQSEAIAWEALGTEARMQKLSQFIEQAESLSLSEPYQARFQLFKKGIWEYMQKGRKKFMELDSLKKPSMQQVSVPCLDNPNPDIDLQQVDWRQAAQLNLYGGLRGEPAAKNQQVKVAHDGNWIYFAYTETDIDPSKLKTNNVVWLNDEWESFFAKQRSKPYKQLGIDAKGAYAGVNHDGIVQDSWDFPGKIKIQNSDNSWTVYLTVKLADLVEGGVKAGDLLYYNVIRSANAKARGCWIPTFAGYHAPDRFGEIYLEAK